MKREIKPGMKFLIPFEVTKVDGQLVYGKTPGGNNSMVLYKSRLEALTPEGGWPREPFKHGDVVVPAVGTDASLLSERVVWGPEVDGVICIRYCGNFYKRDASEYKLASPS